MMNDSTTPTTDAIIDPTLIGDTGDSPNTQPVADIQIIHSPRELDSRSG